MADVYCDYIEDGINGIGAFTKKLSLIPNIYKDLDLSFISAIFELRYILKLVNKTTKKSFDIFKCYTGNETCKMCLGDLYVRKNKNVDSIVSLLISTNRKMERIVLKVPRFKLLYKIFIQTLNKRTLNNLEDFMALLGSFHGKDGKFVKSDELLKMTVNV